MNVQTPFPIWLKQRRRALDLRQEDLAELIGCSASTIRKFELGERRPSRQIAELLVVTLGVPPEERPAFISFARGQGSVPDPSASIAVPVAAQAAHATNLPISLTPLIGREREMEAIQRLLVPAKVRLLTLTGPPGIGKTRLALQVASQLVEWFADGVYFVGLSHVVDPDRVPAAIADVLGLRDKSSHKLLDNIQVALQSKQALLVLDNFEQILDAAPIVLALLEACTDLKVLTTSREALHVSGEQQFHVPALATADPANLPGIEALRKIPAVALFVDRAQFVYPDFALEEENAKAIAAICTRLDGLPLAIELAAAHIRLLSPQEMQVRLDSRLALLTGGARNLPARQRTLRAAIDWSYNLLAQDEQVLFARLGVFVGGFTLGAAKAVCGAANEKFDVPEGVEALLDKNLLKKEEGVGGVSRFTMLELIHDYALERLRESGGEAKIRGLHALYYLAIAEAAPEMLGAKQNLWLEKLEQEHDNIRGVLKWSLNNGNTTLALRLGGAMNHLWYVHGHHREGRRWLEEALATGSGAPASIRALGLRALAHMAQQIPDHKWAIALCEESLALYRAEANLAGIAHVLQLLAYSAMQQGDPERALALATEAMDLGFDPSLRSQTSKLFYMLGAASWFRGDFAQAEEAAMNALALSREEGSTELIAAALNLRALIAHYQGDYSRAEAFYREGLSLAREVGAVVQIAHPILNMGDLALLQGDRARAGLLLTEGLRMFAELGDKQGIAEGLEGVACLAGAVAQPDRAARLFGAAEVLREEINAHFPAFVRAIYERTMVESRRKLGEEAFAAAWAEGRAMSIAKAIGYALQEA